MKTLLSALLLGTAAPSAAQQSDFRPPRLSFTAADYFASLNGDVNSLPDGVETVAVASSSAARATVYQAADSESAGDDAPLSGALLVPLPGGAASHSVTTPDGRRTFLSAHGGTCHNDGMSGKDEVLGRYDLLASYPATAPAAVELWKYCALFVTGGAYVDMETVPLAALGDALADGTNYAVVSSTSDAGVSPSLLTGDTISDPVVAASSAGTGEPVAVSSFLALTEGHRVAAGMVEAIMGATVGQLESHALLLPRALMGLVEKSKGEGEQWGLLTQRCHGVQVSSGEDSRSRWLRHCPSSAGYCCEVLDPTSSYVLFLSRRPLVPAQVIPGDLSLPTSFADEFTADAVYLSSELPFIATIEQEVSSPLVARPHRAGSSRTTPNAYELIVAADALPNAGETGQKCMDCLREKKAAGAFRRGRGAVARFYSCHLLVSSS